MAKRTGRKPLGKLPSTVFPMKFAGEDMEWIAFFAKSDGMDKPDLIRLAVRGYLAKRIEKLKEKRLSERTNQAVAGSDSRA